jgi:hypothetical protein
MKQSVRRLAPMIQWTSNPGNTHPKPKSLIDCAFGELEWMSSYTCSGSTRRLDPCPRVPDRLATTRPRSMGHRRSSVWVRATWTQTAPSILPDQASAALCLFRDRVCQALEKPRHGLNGYVRQSLTDSHGGADRQRILIAELYPHTRRCSSRWSRTSRAFSSTVM